MIESKPIKDAADLLSRFPVSGRHYRHNYKLYAEHHVLQFAKQCSRVAAEKMKIAIMKELRESRVVDNIDQVDPVILNIKAEEVMK